MFSVFAGGTVSSVSSIAFFTCREHREHRERDQNGRASTITIWNSHGTTENSRTQTVAPNNEAQFGMSSFPNHGRVVNSSDLVTF